MSVKLSVRLLQIPCHRLFEIIAMMIIKIELPKLWDIYIHEIFTNSIRLGVHSRIILKSAQVNENTSSICITKYGRFCKGDNSSQRFLSNLFKNSINTLYPRSLYCL